MAENWRFDRTDDSPNYDHSMTNMESQRSGSVPHDSFNNERESASPSTRFDSLLHSSTKSEAKGLADAHTPSSLFDLNSPLNHNSTGAQDHHDDRNHTDFNEFLQTLLTTGKYDGSTHEMHESPFLSNHETSQLNTSDLDKEESQEARRLSEPSYSQSINTQRPNGRNSVNPNDIFRSPMLAPSNEGGPSSVNSNSMSIFSVSMQSTDDGFTPLLSPNTTPMEVGRSGPLPPDFSMPASYMSPLSSPVIDAQPVASDTGSVRSTASTSRRQGSGKSTPIMSASSSRVAKMSPVLRANKRRSSYQNTSLQQQYNSSQSQSANQNTESSGSSDSVSPSERLESTMMPPPASGHSRRSSSFNGAGSTPATPASLMNLPPRRDLNIPLNLSEEELKSAFIATANASYAGQYPNGNPRGGLRRLASSGSVNTSVSPVGSSSIKPKLPISRSSTGAWKAAKNSGRSPVIKPKLVSASASPSMSPKIMPANASMKSSDSSSQLLEMLATKSNYQNIVEGNHSQLGLQYPEHLSADLTSKRTSHKLAEQGRRNRINNALAELAQLISPSIPTNSKATTVESAIVFIKSLQEELETTKEKLAKYEADEKIESKATK